MLINYFQTDIIAYDYAGYGISPHRSSETNFYQDLETVLSYVVTVLRYQLWEIFLWGFSIGTGPTVEIARRYSSLGGVILNSPLASCLAWLDRDTTSKPFDGYAGPDVFSNITKVAEIQTKVLIIHGGNDQIIPSSHAQSLFDKLKTCRDKPVSDDSNNEWLIIVPDADHNDIPTYITNPFSNLRKKVKSILDFMHVAKKMERRKAQDSLQNKFNEDCIMLKKIFSDIRVNDVGTWRQSLTTQPANDE